MLDECIAETSDDLEEVTQSQEPLPKRPRPAILKCFTEILEQSGVTVTGSSSVTEMERYLREPLIDFHRSNTFIWWKENKHQFVQLSQLARRYLSAPPTSVTSERLFSVAGDIYDEKRNRLAPERAEILLFINKNFQLEKGQYNYGDD